MNPPEQFGGFFLFANRTGFKIYEASKIRKLNN